MVKMIMQTRRPGRILYVWLAMLVGFALGAVAFNWRELRSFGVMVFRQSVVARHDNDDKAKAKQMVARLPQDLVHQILQDNPDMNMDDAPKVIVKWTHDDWAFGNLTYYSYQPRFVAKYAKGKWRLLDESDCRGMSFVNKHNVPSAIANRLVKESWLQPEYDALCVEVAEDYNLSAGDLTKGVAVINIEWILDGWATGSAGVDMGMSGFLARKSGDKWKILDHAQDVRPMSTVQKYGIPSNIVTKLIGSGWFDPKADKEEAERKRHADAPGTISLAQGIRVVSCKWYKKPDYGTDGAIECVGQVENYRNTTARYVRISVTLHDKQGRVINTESAYTDPPDIPPGRKSPFKIYSDYYGSAATAQMQVSCD